MVRKVLFILGEFIDSDVDWLVDSGSQETLPSGELLVEEGKPIEALYFVLDGKLEVTANQQSLARLASGEVVGEMSFLDSSPPGATVTAIEPTSVLAIPRARLQSKIASDLGFAARFYRALGVFLADRLRTSVSRLAYGEVEEAEELTDDLLDNVDQAAARFDEILRRLRSR